MLRVKEAYNGINRQNIASEDREDSWLLISVGATRVQTCWKQNNRLKKFKEKAITIGPDNGTEGGFKPSYGMSSSISFQCLYTDMPTKFVAPMK